MNLQIVGRLLTPLGTWGEIRVSHNLTSCVVGRKKKETPV